MNIGLIILILQIGVITCWGQTTHQTEGEDQIKFVFDSNLPDKLYAFFSQDKFKANYKINRNLNPFYLRGDFDGDKHIDYALAIIELKSNKGGILIYYPTTNMYFLVGAGSSIQVGYEDDYSMLDAWEVYDEKIVEQGVTDLKPPKLIGEAILIQKLESSSGLIYWDGKEYRWYQQGD